MQRKFVCTLLTLFQVILVFSQQGIKGKVTDSHQNPISDCEVYVTNSDHFTQTDSLGNFILELNPGEYTLEYSIPDYTGTTQKIKIDNQQFTNQSIVLERKEKSIAEVTITGQSLHKTESGLVNLQKKSVEIVENVSSSQLTKQGVGNVASAVTKATGTFKQEGTGTIFIRGLGDRYNSTSLNGLSIPSNNPEYKNIDLSFFKTDIVEYISMEKVFSPRISGDVAGANINIVSREYRGKGYVKAGISSGINTQAVSSDKFWQKSGTNFYGFKNTKLPGNVLSGYNFNTSWDWKNRNNPFNSGISLEARDNYNIGSEGKISLLGSLSFDNEYVYSKGVEKSINAQGFSLKNLSSQKYEYSTNTTGLANATYQINTKNKISYNLLYIHSSNQVNRYMQGYIKDLAEDNTGVIRRAEYTLSTLWVNQLLGKHELTDRLIFNWSAAYNNLNSKNPDRQQNTIKKSDEGSYMVFISNSDSDQNRYFDDLKEKEYTGRASLDYFFGKSKENKLILGYQGKNKKRDFQATQVNFKISNPDTQVDVNNFDDFFNQANYNSGLFIIRTFRGNADIPTALLPSQFHGTQTTHAGYSNLEYKLSDRWIAQVGIRVENVNQKINWDTNLSVSTEDKKLDKTKFLPSLNIKYSSSDRSNIRFAASKTYTLPQFKEIAPFYYEDVTEISFGNPYLYPSDNYNADIKWEFFPKSGELFSVTGFGKYIKNPIAKLTVSSSANESSYANVGDWAYVFGAEMEFRKDLLQFTHGKLYTFLNLTFMESKSELNEEKIRKETRNFINASFDKDKDELQGASKLLANVNLGYNQKIGNSSLDFVVSYAYVGKNIYALSYGSTGNLVDQDLHILDANLKVTIAKNTSIGVSAKNLLNPSYKRNQETGIGNLTQKSYDRGRFFGISLSQQF